MNGKEERAAVLAILAETKGDPEERERRLRKLSDDNAIAVGCVCRCGEKNVTCPRHGKRR